MKNNGDPKSVELTIISESPDSEEAVLFETLGEDISDFFFGCKVLIMS